MKPAKALLITLLAPLLLAACSKEDEEIVTPLRIIDIATFLGQTDEGMRFETWNLAERLELTTTQRFQSPPADGTRILVSYSAQMTDTAKRPLPITIEGAGMINYHEATPLSLSEFDALPKMPMQLISLWLTGPYLNLTAKVPCREEAVDFGLATMKADDGTLHCKPFAISELPPQSESIFRLVYASFLLGEEYRTQQANILFVNGEESATCTGKDF